MKFDTRNSTLLALAAASLLATGCEKKAPPLLTEPPKPQQQQLPPRPRYSPQTVSAVRSIFESPQIDPSVKKALQNPHAIAALRQILASNPPQTYMRNSFDGSDPEIGRDVVRILQQGLHDALPRALETYGHMSDRAKTPAEKRSYQTDIDHGRQYLKALLHPDGAFGKKSHHARALVTMAAFLRTRDQSGPFPHVKEDSGSSDTAIGPRTLKLLAETSPVVAIAINPEVDTDLLKTFKVPQSNSPSR